MAHTTTPVTDARKVRPVRVDEGRARKAPGQPGGAGEGTGQQSAQAARQPRRDFVDTIWVMFCSIRFAVVLNVALALAAMLGTIIPQMPQGIQNFPREYEQFLKDAQARYGDFSGLLHWAGFYNLYDSLWFRMLVVIVCFSIIICTLNRWQPILRQIRNPMVRVPESYLSGLSEKARFRTVPLGMHEAGEVLKSVLRKSRYRVLAESAPDGSALYLYGDRDRWTKLVTFVSHGALVMLILTAAGLANFGWREQSVLFYPGQPVNVGHDTDFDVVSKAFWIEYYPDGKSVKEYKNTLAVIEGGREVLTKTIVVNDPLSYKGVNFFLVSYQPILYAKAVDDHSGPLALRRMGATGPITDTTSAGEARVDFQFTSADNLPLDFIQLPVRGHVLTLELTYYQDVTRSSDENPPVYVRAYVDQNFDSPVYDAFLPRQGALRVPGYESIAFTFRQDTASVLEVAKDPGMMYVGVWFVIMTLGFGISLYTTVARCWARIVPDPDRPGTVNIMLAGLAEKNKVSFEHDFRRMAERMTRSLAAAASSSPGQVAAAREASMQLTADR